ncbi:MAG: hypothetical protein Q8P57_02980 [Candidatus Pacearchaeota archaeon]|nr:hypothetical protein [Candidatus Pacearchaeota archaeon]
MKKGNLFLWLFVFMFFIGFIEIASAHDSSYGSEYGGIEYGSYSAFYNDYYSNRIPPNRMSDYFNYGGYWQNPNYWKEYRNKKWGSVEVNNYYIENNYYFNNYPERKYSNVGKTYSTPVMRNNMIIDCGKNWNYRLC